MVDKAKKKEMRVMANPDWVETTSLEKPDSINYFKKSIIHTLKTHEKTLAEGETDFMDALDWVITDIDEKEGKVTVRPPAESYGRDDIHEFYYQEPLIGDSDYSMEVGDTSTFHTLFNVIYKVSDDWKGERKTKEKTPEDVFIEEATESDKVEELEDEKRRELIKSITPEGGWYEGE